MLTASGGVPARPSTPTGPRSISGGREIPHTPNKCTPPVSLLLVYAADGRLAAQGRAWHRALTAAGVDSKLIMVPGAGHLFASPLAQRQLYQAGRTGLVRASGPAAGAPPPR